MARAAEMNSSTSGQPEVFTTEELRAETRAAVESLVQVMSFAVGVTFASLAGTGVLEPDDAANRLRLIAETLRTIDTPDPAVAEAAAHRLEVMADTITTGTSLH